LIPPQFPDSDGWPNDPAPLLRRDIVDASVIAAIAMGLYIATLQPDFGGPEDTPKFQLVGYVLGTPHPPGYPLYVMLSHLFVTMVRIGTIAYRANLFSAVMAALACGLTYLLARQIRSTRWPAACAALALGAGTSFWRNAVFAEVYSLAAVMAALTIVLLLHWGARGGTARLLAAVAAIGLGCGNHLTIAGLAPVCVGYVLWRDRRVVTPRFVAAAAGVLLVCLSQYAFIIIRSLQGAPYLESRAGSLSALLRVVRAEDFASKRFAFAPSVLVSVQAPAVSSVIGHELGIAGVALLVIGAIAAVRRRSASAAVAAGAALGTLIMVLNLSGDLQGFITPLVVFLWPIAAIGVDAIRALIATRASRTAALAVAVVVAVLMPTVNVAANYRNTDQSRQTDAGRFFRSLYAQLPDGAAVIAEDYFYDMALRYLMLTGEGGPRDKGVAPVGFGVGPVQDAKRLGRRVFGFARAATFFGAEGWAFERTPLDGPPLAHWIDELPRGTAIAGAAAYSAVPSELAAAFHHDAREAARAHPFTAFAFVIGRSPTVWSESEAGGSATFDAASLPAGIALPGHVAATADPQGARVVVGDRVVAATDMGLALAVLSAGGALLRTFEFRTGDPLHVPPEGALYEWKTDMPCATISTEWSDVTPILATGSWLATFPRIGSVAVETETAGESCGVGARAAELLGGGLARNTGATRGEEGAAFASEFTRAAIGRPLFRLTLDCIPRQARARLQPGGAAGTLKICGQKPPPLFAGDGARATVRPDFESEAYFGAGWRDPERTPIGRTRRGDARAALLLPLPAGFSYDMTIDLAGPAQRVDVALNGRALASCDMRNARPCAVTLPADAIRGSVSAVTVAVADAATAGSSEPPLIFRGARLVRRTK
jgi:hypothetical protein